MAEQTKNDERAAKIHQDGPEHDINECDASEHGRYEQRVPGEGMTGQDTRKSTVKPF
jgi:hypothetical protein